jgi:hypothetical protein
VRTSFVRREGGISEEQKQLFGTGKTNCANREKLRRALEWAREQRELNAPVIGRFMKKQADKAREFSV